MIAEDDARAHQVLQVALDLRRPARSLALVQDVEAEVEEHRRHERGHRHNSVEDPEAGIAQALGGGEHRDQCDQPRYDTRSKDQNCVAQRP